MKTEKKCCWNTSILNNILQLVCICVGKDIGTKPFQLAKQTYGELKGLTHYNGTKLVELYSDTDFTDSSQQGPVVAFNLKRASGQYIGFNEVCLCHIFTL